MAKKSRRAINFDLNQASLRELYPSDNEKDAYADIRSFLEKNGFEHRQGSGYVSLAPLTDYAVTLVVEQLSASLQWLADCISTFDVTNIGQIFDMKDTLVKAHKSKQNRPLGGRF